jgi:hypothetical protein
MEHSMPAAPINFPNAGHFYSNLTRPIEIDLNFIVDQANGNGLGVRSVKSNGYVRNVFMHTSASPGINNGILNPNPAVGYAIIQLAGNFNRYIGGFAGVEAPLTATSTTSLTAGNPYVITNLGNTTLAQWQAAGLPMGFIPAVGSAFIAVATASIGGTGTVGVPAASSVLSIQIIGDPNQEIANSNTSANGGMQLLVSFIGASGLVTPSNNSVVGMTIKLDQSGNNVDGL